MTAKYPMDSISLMCIYQNAVQYSSCLRSIKSSNRHTRSPAVPEVLFYILLFHNILLNSLLNQRTYNYPQQNNATYQRMGERMKQISYKCYTDSTVLCNLYYQVLGLCFKRFHYISRGQTPRTVCKVEVEVTVII